jgi:hypothetical protein
VHQAVAAAREGVNTSFVGPCSEGLYVPCHNSTLKTSVHITDVTTTLRVFTHYDSVAVLSVLSVLFLSPFLHFFDTKNYTTRICVL